MYKLICIKQFFKFIANKNYVAVSFCPLCGSYENHKTAMLNKAHTVLCLTCKFIIWMEEIITRLLEQGCYRVQPGYAKMEFAGLLLGKNSLTNCVNLWAVTGLSDTGYEWGCYKAVTGLSYGVMSKWNVQGCSRAAAG